MLIVVPSNRNPKQSIPISETQESDSMHAVEFLKQPSKQFPSVIVMSGGQRHFKNAVLDVLRKLIIDDDDTCLTRFNGREAALHSVSDELHTISMWGDRRLVLVDDADDFVTKNRGALEKLVDKLATKSVLVLDVNSWVKSTRLYKQIQAKGIEIECSDLKGPQLLKWLQEAATDEYSQNLTRDAAALMIDLVGDELGMLNSELAKLASYVGTKGKIDINDVKGLVGGWRTETTWAMTDATRDDDLDFALMALDQLLTAGEPCVKLLGGITYVFKKFSLATDLSRTTPLDQALRSAGTFPLAMAPSQSYLRRLGREKAERILQRILEVDSGIKGSNPLRERIQLERLLVELAGRL